MHLRACRMTYVSEPFETLEAAADEFKMNAYA